MNRRTAVLALIALVASPLLAIAQPPTYPAKPIRLIVPFPAGGSADIMARAVSQKMSETWRQPVVVDNRVGASGNIGADMVARSAGDGYTLLLCTVGTHAIHQTLYKKLPFDPINDFTPVAYIAGVPNVAVVHPSVPVKNVPELIAYIRARPGQVNFGSSMQMRKHCAFVRIAGTPVSFTRFLMYSQTVCASAGLQQSGPMQRRTCRSAVAMAAFLSPAFRASSMSGR